MSARIPSNLDYRHVMAAMRLGRDEVSRVSLDMVYQEWLRRLDSLAYRHPTLTLLNVWEPDLEQVAGEWNLHRLEVDLRQPGYWTMRLRGDFVPARVEGSAAASGDHRTVLAVVGLSRLLVQRLLVRYRQRACFFVGKETAGDVHLVRDGQEENLGRWDADRLAAAYAGPRGPGRAYFRVPPPTVMAVLVRDRVMRGELDPLTLP